MGEAPNNVISQLRAYWQEKRESYAVYQSAKVDALDCIEYLPPFYDTPAERFYRQKPGLKRREHLPAPLHVTKHSPQEYGIKKFPDPQDILLCDQPLEGIERIAIKCIRDEEVGELFKSGSTLFYLDRAGITVSQALEYPPRAHQGETLKYAPEPC